MLRPSFRLGSCLFLCAACIFLFGSGPGAAADGEPVTLQHKFPDGRRTTTRITTRTQQALTLKQEKHEAGSEQEMVVVTECGIRDKDGELRERVRIESLKAKLTMPGGVVLEFDSTAPAAAAPGTRFDPLLDMIKLHAGSSWSVLRDREHRAKSVDGRDKVLETLDQTRREAVKRQFEADYLRDRANLDLLRVPSRPLKPDDSWDTAETIRLDAGQSLVFHNTLTYRGLVTRHDRPLHQIDVNTRDVAYTIDRNSAAGLSLSSSSLRPTMIEGVILFDAERGQVIESREAVRIAGDVIFQVQEHRLEGHIDLTMSTTAVVQ